MIRTGTAHFVSRDQAFMHYCGSTQAVADLPEAWKFIDDKIAAGEVFICRPSTKPGQLLVVIEGRYHIEEV